MSDIYHDGSKRACFAEPISGDGLLHFFSLNLFIFNPPADG